MGKALNDYYQSYYKHPQNGYDPKYFMIPPKECLHCICYYCFNKLCPHCVGYRYSLSSGCVKDKKIRSKDMIPLGVISAILYGEKRNLYMTVIITLISAEKECYTHLSEFGRKNQI